MHISRAKTTKKQQNKQKQGKYKEKHQFSSKTLQNEQKQANSKENATFK